MSCCDICDELAQIKAEQAWEREALTLLLLHAGLQVPGTTPPSGFQVDAVRMETTDWISSATNWADSPTGSMFCWVKLTPALSTIMAIMGPDGYSYNVAMNTNTLSVDTYIFDSTESNYVYGETSSSLYAESVWVAVFADWKTDEATGNKLLQVFIGDTDGGITPQDDGTGSFSAIWSGQTLLVGKSGFGNEFDGDMAEFWLSMTRLDFSVEANRRKFYSATGKPVDVGSDGSTPTGSAPEVYLSVRPGDAAADFVTNRGSGNNFTQNGTLTIASTSPSD